MTSIGNFGLTGLERVRFAVARLEDARAFAVDWGLEAVSASDGNHVYRTVDGSEVEIVEAGADHRPVGAESGICEIIWGVESEANLAAIAEELRRDRKAELDEAGMLHSVDDLGIPIGFRVARRAPVPYAPSLYNAPGHPTRVDQRAPRYQRARPHELSHIAISVDNAGIAARFYIERLGFIVSDRYADRGVFMRCSSAGNHHHIFFVNGKVSGTRFNHLAFKVRDVHEVIGGGQYIDAQGWTTFAGPGRHIVSSANFWYFVTPFGGAWEYAADEDMVTGAWESQDFAAEAHIFSEWMFGLEKSDGTLRGPISQSVAKELK